MASIKQLGDRRFKITVSNGYRPDGKKICKAKTIRVPGSIPKRGIRQYVAHEAEELERQFKTGYAEDGTLPFQEYAERWLARQVRYAPSTLESYRRMLERVYPFIGAIPINRLRPIALENMLAELRKRTYRGRPIEVAKRVQVIFLRKSNGLVDFPQPFGEGIRVNELPVLIREEVGTEFPMRLPGFHLLPAAVVHKDPPDVGRENDLTTVAVFGWAFHHTFSRDNAAGATDGQEQDTPTELEILPLESAEFAPAVAGAQGEKIEHPVVLGLLCQSIQQFLNLHGRGNVLRGAAC